MGVGLSPRGGRRMAGKSRVSREAHARFCERLGVKFPGATRPPCRSGCFGHWSFGFVRCPRSRTFLLSERPWDRACHGLLDLCEEPDRAPPKRPFTHAHGPTSSVPGCDSHSSSRSNGIGARASPERPTETFSLLKTIAGGGMAGRALSRRAISVRD